MNPSPSTFTTTTTTNTTATTPLPTVATARWWREPLLHFLMLGAVLFVVDHYLIAKADDPRTIVMGSEVDKEARELFKSSRGQEPTSEQLAALRQVWLDNEVLYREGLALRVDQGDSAIRERVIFKALSVVESSLNLPNVDDKALNAWFESHRDKYDEPGRYDFQEAVLTGNNTEAAVRAFCAELNRGQQGDTQAGLRVFKGRPHSNLVQSYGAEFAKLLEGLPPGEWQALQTREGWRAMRLDAVTAGKPASFEVLRGVVLQDWTDATMAAQRTAAVRTLAKKYKVRVEGSRS
jgi:PPIC-type PPIASE domain